jgi:CRP-like cAMP-binding protein
LIEKSHELHFKKGDLIRREGQQPDAFYLILQGMVNISKVSLNGKEFTIDCRFKGETLGWGQVLRGGFFTATYYALDDIVLLSFGKEIFIAFINRNPIIQSRISNSNVDLINILFNKLIDVSCDTAGNRLIRTLITLNMRCGNVVNLTHLDIAKMSWTTLETTTRVLTKLKKENILSTDRGKIVIKNPEKLNLYIENQIG